MWFSSNFQHKTQINCLFHNQTISVYVGVAVWLVGLIYAILVVCISSNDAFNVFNSNDADLIEWEVSTSDFALSISNLFIVLLALAIVCISYGAIVIYLWRASRKQGEKSVPVPVFSSRTDLSPPEWIPIRPERD